MKKNNLKKFCSLIMIMIFMIGHTMWPFLVYADDTSIPTVVTTTTDTTTPPSDPVTPSDTVQSPD
ncbi:MAG: hypothetical protein JWM92_315, partial [Candidatus Nomurabacteria bacterium]|nr:hypothetical protein [Candidatus Nomurabacteria bacterium]